MMNFINSVEFEKMHYVLSFKIGLKMKLLLKMMLIIQIMALTACSGLNQFSKKGHFPLKNNTGLLILGVDIKGWSSDPRLTFIKHDMSIADRNLAKITTNPRKQGYHHEYFILELEEGPWSLKEISRFVSSGFYNNKYTTTFDERYVFDIKRNQAIYFGEFSIDSKKKQSYLHSSLLLNREQNNPKKVTEHLKGFPNISKPFMVAKPRVVKRHDRLKEMLESLGLPLPKNKTIYM
jgi:hypothetical protein